MTVEGPPPKDVRGCGAGRRWGLGRLVCRPVGSLGAQLRLPLPSETGQRVGSCMPVPRTLHGQQGPRHVPWLGRGVRGRSWELCSRPT